MAEVAGQPGTIVFTGAPGAPDARGVPIEVHSWIRGRGPTPVVWLAAWSIGPDVEACDGPPPPAGVPMLFVLERPSDGSDPYGGMCAQVSRLDSAAGARALVEAVVAFGPGLTISQATGPPAAVDVTDVTGRLAATAGGLGVAALGALAAIALVRRRRSRADPGPR
jgi:hypothetical protein